VCTEKNTDLPQITGKLYNIMLYRLGEIQTFVDVIVWKLDLQLPMQSLPITNNVMSSNLAQAIQHYVIKFASDLWQIRVFLCSIYATLFFVGLFHSNAGKNVIYNIS
jgi:hypothetical protein